MIRKWTPRYLSLYILVLILLLCNVTIWQEMKHEASTQEEGELEDNLQHWILFDLEKADPTLRIIILTYNRAKSLKRLFDSLGRCHYYGHRIDVDVWIDVNELGDANEPVLQVSEAFRWRFGKKTVHVRENNVGLRKQWIETWNESLGGNLHRTIKEKVLILEDDLELSPFFFLWLMKAHESYAKRNDIAGISLQRATLCAAKCKMEPGGPIDSGIFLYPLIGSWGFSPKIDHWLRFLSFLRTYDETIHPPYIDHLTSSKFYKKQEEQGLCPGKNCMWTILHILYSTNHLDQYIVYAKSKHPLTLAANYRESGMNFRFTGGQDFPTLEMFDASIFNFPLYPPEVDWNGKVLDFYS